ncbi:uncharacterized protein DS421_20g694480 [Arachis hypogaea]|nr:uncharacterized protein DS421_20g694480 [Arachis hypogaea]
MAGASLACHMPFISSLACHAKSFKWHAHPSSNLGVPCLRTQVARPLPFSLRFASGNLYWRATPEVWRATPLLYAWLGFSGKLN